jgi:phenylalanyl-tRNA synthetase beta chain
MPKIEVNEKLFFSLLGETCSYSELEERLAFAKAELDGLPDENLPHDERVIKIELNDTNRPDLWSTAGIARQLRLHKTGKQRDFSAMLSTREKQRDCGERVVLVDPALCDIRPFMTAFVISGKAIDEPMLLDIIQTQEKLCWNFGRKRRSISMGVYRSALISWPVHYKAVDPDQTRFIPLQCETPMTCRQIIAEHPKGKEYGWILSDKKKYPLLTDNRGEVLSMATIINSATLGAVQVGDTNLLVEMTGTDMPSLLLASNIVACDFADAGYEILPCKVCHPYDTGFGKDICAPFYFQAAAGMSLAAMNKLLGSSLSEADARDALTRMGSEAARAEQKNSDVVFTLKPPAYRNDFLHEVDAIEDVMIGAALAKFPPEKPSDFTIGRLTPVTLLSRKVKSLMTGMGYQEMIFNYLGSKKEFIDNMNIDARGVIEISNPMSENYQFVRPSIIASLLASEAASGNAVYPHKIFETGKTAFLDSAEVTGTKTVQSLGFLTASGTANYNDAASETATLLYFLGREYVVRESADARFIAGRQAEVLVDGKKAGVFGEVNPLVLENWAITTPCAAGEINLDMLL